jgi:hypothetical protein
MTNEIKFMMKSFVFYDITPRRLMKVSRYSSKTSVDFQWTTWRYIPEDRAFHDHCCENHKFCIFVMYMDAGSTQF